MPAQPIAHFSQQSVDEKRRAEPLWRENNVLADKNATTKGSVYWVKPTSSASAAIERYSIHDSKTTHAPQYAVHTQYRGEWQNNQKHGHGVQLYGTDKKYDGRWQFDQRCGTGKLYMNAAVLEQQAKIKSNPVLTDATNKLQRTAQTAASIRAQQRQRSTPHTDLDHIQWVLVYDGEWLNDERSGSGECRSDDGSLYVGEWRHGKRHGTGTLTDRDGNVYSGEFENDLQHGTGSYTVSASGDIYQGEYQQGKRHGKGVFYYRDKQKVYVGEWSADQPRCGSYMSVAEYFATNPLAASDVMFRDVSTDSMSTESNAEQIPRLRVADADNIITEQTDRLRSVER